MNTLIGHSKISLKEINQDSAITFSIIDKNMYSIAVADGIGSDAGSEISSHYVLTEFQKRISEVIDKKLTIYSQIQKVFSDIHLNLINYLSANSENRKFHSNQGTTLITVVEYHKNFTFSYLGNGAIWHIKGNFNFFPESVILPFSMSNYLVPHIVVDENGRNVLTKYISIDPDNKKCIPTYGTINYDEEFGDIFMICSDGIYSNDEILVGKDEKGTSWIKVSEPLQIFLEDLNTEFRLYKTAINKINLTNFLDGYLQKLHDKNLVSDDCAIAVIINQKALEYQQQILNANDNNK